MTFQSIDDTMKGFVGSAEFKGQLGNRSDYTLSAGEGIEVDVPSEVLQKLLKHTQQQWTKFGSERPYWSVLNYDGADNAAVSVRSGKISIIQ